MRLVLVLVYQEIFPPPGANGACVAQASLRQGGACARLLQSRRGGYQAVVSLPVHNFGKSRSVLIELSID